MPSISTPEEIADRLRVARRTVYEWLRTGELKGIRVGGQWRIDEDALTAFLGGAIVQIQVRNEIAAQVEGNDSVEVLSLGEVRLAWSAWRPWLTLRTSGSGVPYGPGVYEVRRVSSGDLRVHQGKASSLYDRIRKLVTGVMHSTGIRILTELSAEELECLEVRWAATDRPGAAEEELHRRYREGHGGLSPEFDGLGRRRRG